MHFPFPSGDLTGTTAWGRQSNTGPWSHSQMPGQIKAWDRDLDRLSLGHGSTALRQDPRADYESL